MKPVSSAIVRVTNIRPEENRSLVTVNPKSFPDRKYKAVPAGDNGQQRVAVRQRRLFGLFSMTVVQETHIHVTQHITIQGVPNGSEIRKSLEVIQDLKDITDI